MSRRALLATSLLILAGTFNAALAQPLPHFDFTRPPDRQGWLPAHHIASIDPSPEGLVININGNDPYLHGPARDYPEGQRLWLRMRLKSDEPGMLQVFYFNTHPTEEKSVRAFVRAGRWEDLRIPLPPLGKGYRLRIDPPGTRGRATIASISFDKLTPLTQPTWPKPQPPSLKPDSLKLHSGDLVITHTRDELGGFTLTVADRPVAIGFNRPLIGYMQGDQQRWIDLHLASKTQATSRNGELIATTIVKDADGANWTITHRFSPGNLADTIHIQAEASVDQDRDVIFLPMLALCPGVGSFAQSKTAALFPGLEYLDKDEPSSSEADIIGPGSKRQVPDSAKITMPLMTVLADGRYVGLVWEPQPDISAVFDSPDRLFNSGGHVMGLIFPGSNGNNRTEGSLLPHWPQKLAANKPLKLNATIIGGKADSVIPAVQQYVALRPIPPVPDVHMDLQGYVKMTAAGWLDSKIREGGTYRHAYPGQFNPHPAADAALFIDWLATRSTDQPLASRLAEASESALAKVDPAHYNFASVSHVRYPVASLLYGHVIENAARSRQHAQGLLSRFQPDGSILYTPGKVDYGKTHFSKEANGLTAQVVWSLLEEASVCGDKKLIAEALRMLRALDKFANTAPRGAQTWECPLHTPDILASAHLVHAYTRGYELTGDQHFLNMAKHWAWTGVPFVYLVKPTDYDVGPYATIAVYGATNWVAPNWMGLPVQWCGLVYADALYLLAPHDPSSPWKHIADGITASGIQQTFPLASNAERVGLLPDSYTLRAEHRNDPAINPGTVQANAIRFFKQPPLYSFHAFRPFGPPQGMPFAQSGLYVHAPAAIFETREAPTQVSFKLSGCIKPTYYILLSGLTTRPNVTVNSKDPAPANVEYSRPAGLLVLHLQGDATVSLSFE